MTFDPHQGLHVERRGPVLEVTLDRPKANALDSPTSRKMGEIFADFRDDPELRVAIVTGAGDCFFCAGWDLKAIAEAGVADHDSGIGGFGGLQELPRPQQARDRRRQRDRVRRRPRARDFR